MWCRDEGRLAGAGLAAVNAFLLREGANVRSAARLLQAAAQPLVARLIRNSRDLRLSETVLTFLRIQLNLGGLQVG